MSATAIEPPQNQELWKICLQRAIFKLSDLFDAVDLNHVSRQEFADDPQFPLLVTREFVSRMKKNSPSDPLLLQVAPSRKEQLAVAGFTKDPLQENRINPTPGLLHRYQGRVLLTLTGACPVHCRFCFRRYFDYADNNPLKSNLSKVVDYISNDDSIEEVIYSGGDPLLVSDDHIKMVSQSLLAIPHLQRLRIHTRVPIFLPSRITPQFLEMLAKLPLPVTIVIHCNHPQEIDAEVFAALQKLKTVSTVLNQAVLLANINDSVDVLSGLNKKLFNAGVLPYYLHSLDPVAGAAHFAVSETKGQRLIQELANQLPGYLVPKFVKTIPLSRHKVQIL